MKLLTYTLTVFFFTLMSNAQSLTAEQIVQANLDAYNKQDIETFMSYIADDVTMHNFNDGTQTATGKAAVLAIYEPYFKASPNLHSTILKRTVFDNKVIDHESITGARGNDNAFEIVLIYETAHNKITKMTAIRKRN